MEWTIENFSCWNADVHGKRLKSTDRFATLMPIVYPVMELYPRGFNGRGEHLAVRFCGCTSSGDLSIVASDGSDICTLPVAEGMDLELPLGPKYEEVVARIRENRDRLVILLSFGGELRHSTRIRTVIDVVETTCKIDADAIIVEEEGSKILLLAEYGNQNARMYVRANSGDGSISLQLLEQRRSRVLLVKTSLSLLGKEDALVERETNERVFFRDNNNALWTFSESLHRRELKRKGISALLLSLEIINGDMNTIKDRVSYYSQGVSRLTKICSKEGTPDDILPIQQNHALGGESEVSGDLDTSIKEEEREHQDTEPSEVSREGSGDQNTPSLASFLDLLNLGIVESQWETSFRLYYTAIKLLVPDFPRKIASKVRQVISVPNVCDILAFSIKHQLSELTRECVTFVLDHFNDVMRSQGWRNFVEREPSLAEEAVRLFSSAENPEQGGDL